MRFVAVQDLQPGMLVDLTPALEYLQSIGAFSEDEYLDAMDSSEFELAEVEGIDLEDIGPDFPCVVFNNLCNVALPRGFKLQISLDTPTESE